jgi:hypothetical protein
MEHFSISIRVNHYGDAARHYQIDIIKTTTSLSYTTHNTTFGIISKRQHKKHLSPSIIDLQNIISFKCYNDLQLH